MKGNIQVDKAFATLAGKDLASAITNSVSDTTRVSSCKCIYAVGDLTEGTDVGPFLVGVAHSDYSDTEIEEFIENAGAWEIGNMVQREVAQRRIRIVGTINNKGGAAATNDLADGRPVTTKLGWVLEEAQSLRFWVYNTGNNAVATTIPNYKVFGHANLWAM